MDNTIIINANISELIIENIYKKVFKKFIYDNIEGHQNDIKMTPN